VGKEICDKTASKPVKPFGRFEQRCDHPNRHAYVKVDFLEGNVCSASGGQASARQKNRVMVHMIFDQNSCTADFICVFVDPAVVGA
jgi:hypothetical protein